MITATGLAVLAVLLFGPAGPSLRSHRNVHHDRSPACMFAAFPPP